MKKVAFYTLGCKLNFAETSTIARSFEEDGYIRVDFDDPADIYVINTCSVTENADKQFKQIVRKALKTNPKAFLAAVGCYVPLKPEELASVDGVDLVLGAKEKFNITQYIDDLTKNNEGVVHSCEIAETDFYVGSYSIGDRTRAFLKVQDGCSYFCTYCTIPFARGFSRNPTIASLVAQAEQAASEGGKEIVLTGVNIGDFGVSTNETFFDLIKALDAVEGIKRFRISSLEPNLLEDRIIEYCANSRAFMPHFHLPLQSGSNEVLKFMKRKYNRELFADKVKRIKTLIPNAFIGVDVMVGCRGEEPQYFEDCYNFLNELDITQLHVFPYSERPGTAALSIPYVVNDKDKKLRSRRLLELSDAKTQAFYAKHIGQQAQVLFEKNIRGKAMHGFTDNYIRVELPAHLSKSEFDNQIMTVKLGDFNHDKTALRVELID